MLAYPTDPWTLATLLTLVTWLGVTTVLLVRS